MTPEEFIAAVANMRNAQKDYFRTRSQQTLERSKALEKAVDKMLIEMASAQKEMFP